MAKNETKITSVPGKQEIIIEREFDAPRELVFKACTDPQLIPQWWGPRYLSTSHCPLGSGPHAPRTVLPTILQIN
jgi:hypothetical protein